MPPVSRRCDHALRRGEVQAQGQIPAEEDFDPIMLWHSGKTLEEIHPHWIALRPRLHIEKLHKKGRLPVGHTCSVTFTDDHENYRGIEWIDVGADQVVCVEVRCANSDSRCIWAIFSGSS